MRSERRAERGAVAAEFGLLLLPLLMLIFGFLGLGHAFMLRSQMQNAAMVGARNGALTVNSQGKSKWNPHLIRNQVQSMVQSQACNATVDPELNGDRVDVEVQCQYRGALLAPFLQAAELLELHNVAPTIRVIASAPVMGN